MTNPHAKAVEAAAMAYMGTTNRSVPMDAMNAAITAYLAAMRAEGWVMVRDVGEMPARAMEPSFGAGWNACRAAMLKGAGDGQG